MQARDPHWLHAYWEVTEPDTASARRTLGADGAPVLRVYELTGPPMTERAVRSSFDVALTPEARDWYVEVAHPAAWWCLDLLLTAPGGRWARLARSNVVETPSDHPSDEVDDQWGLLDQFGAQYGAGRGGPGGERTTSPGSGGWLGRPTPTR